VVSVFVVATYSQASLASKGAFVGLFQIGPTSSTWNPSGLQIMTTSSSDDEIDVSGSAYNTNAVSLSEGSPVTHDDPALYYGYFDPNEDEVGGAFNGTEKTPVTETNSLSTVGYLSVGNLRGISIGAGAYANVDDYVCETIALKKQPTAHQRQVIEGYLAHKWGFNLPVGHPYRLYAP
jgi:hypothetical protein